MKPQRGRGRVLLQTVASLGVGVLLFGSAGSADGQSSASYEVTRSVMSGGGGRSSSASYSLTGTLGQPSPVHVSESENYTLGSGFWDSRVPPEHRFGIGSEHNKSFSDTLLLPSPGE